MAGRLIALLYLFCVIVPGAALAFGVGPAPCLDELSMSVGHDNAMGHMHGRAAHDHDIGGHVHDMAGLAHHDNGHHHGKACPGPCCAMMCVSALPADLPAVAVVSARPVSARIFESDRSLRGEAPPRLYRPPIA